MTASLSILIPVFNQSCGGLVARLRQLCDAVAWLEYEIIVADDASTNLEIQARNALINGMPNCRFVVKEQNGGAGATRNFLAKSSRYERLLFLDCDVTLPDNFIRNYLEVPLTDVLNGGLSFLPPADGDVHNLRYLYEKREAPKHTAQIRNKQPFASFRSTNFMVRREVMQACPFDETLRRYEDVLWGKHLEQNGFKIVHIDNPVLIDDYDDNPSYLRKVEKDMDNLFLFRKEFSGFSPLLSVAQKIDALCLSGFVRLFCKIFASKLRKNLSSKRPCLSLLNVYKLSYFLNIKK